MVHYIQVSFQELQKVVGFQEYYENEVKYTKS
jgi:hypothetical protein